MAENFPQDGADLANPLGEIIPLFTDFETFYSADYTLTKLDPASYILDPRFESICLGVANLYGAPTLIDGPEIPYFVKSIKSRRVLGPPVAMVSHNAQFDMAIMSWRYDFQPDLIIDTMAMSRTVLGPLLRSHSLSSVADFFGLPGKGSMVKDVKGMTRADIKACGMWDKEVEYCLHDTWLCREIYKKLFASLTPDEIVLHDILTRCTTEPVLRVDRPMLQVHLEQVLQQKAQVLAQVQSMGIGKAHLMSNPKLADVLRSLGVEPPTKLSPTTNETTYAFARTDEDFTDLLEHPNGMVRAVVEARLETKSTIEESRTRRFLGISNLDFPGKGDCIMPMPVVIGAAHTHRVGGGWDLNVQNMGRGSVLRDAIHAEDGHMLLVVDSKQIECRDCAWLCDQADLLEEFRRGEDVYCNFGPVIFGQKITKENKPERFLCKTARLQLGYASGWLKFQNTVRVNSIKEMGQAILLSDWHAQEIVAKYRASHRSITWMWRVLDNILGLMANNLPEYGQGNGETIKCVQFYRNLMIGPTGLPLHFPELHYQEDNGSWWFRDGKRWRRTYGASLLETICQHVARCIVFGAAVRLRNPMASLRSRLVHSAHDELVYMVPNEHIETAKIWAQTEMNRPPSWAPDLPLDCDIGVATRYGEAK